MNNPIDGAADATSKIKDVTVKRRSEGNRNGAEHRVVDHGWAWVVLLACTIGSIIGSGQFFNVGLYFYIFLKEFRQSRSATMWITAAQGTSAAVSGILASNLILTIGARKMMMYGSVIMGTSYGIMFFVDNLTYAIPCFASAGVGATFLLISNVEAIGLYFKKRLNLATGVVLAGGGLGVTIIGHEIEWAVDYFGWRGAMLIQAALLIQICVCAATIYGSVGESAVTKPGGPEDGGRSIGIIPAANRTRLQKQSKAPKNDQHEYLTDLRFWVQMAGFTFYFASITMTFQMLKDYVISEGFQFSYGTVMICMGVANSVGRVSGGILSSVINPVLLNGIVTVMCSCAIATFLVTPVEAIVLTGITMFGFSNGLQGAPMTVSWAAIFGRERMAVLFGYSLASGGIPTLAMSPLAGYIVDATGSFMPVMALSSLSMMASGLLFLATHCIHGHRSGDHKLDHIILDKAIDPVAYRMTL